MNVNFSRNLVALRKLRGYTQESLAEKCGVSRQAITKWENGSSLPDLYRLTELAEIFETGLDELVCGNFIEPKSDNEKEDDSDEEGVNYKALFYKKMLEQNDIADIKRRLLEAYEEEDEEGGELYRDYLTIISATDEKEREEMNNDRFFCSMFDNFEKLIDEGNHELFLLMADYLMILGHGTAYKFLDFIDIIRNRILKYNSYNGGITPDIVEEEGGGDLEEYIFWMRKIAERLPDYARIIMDEMDHMENDRTWSDEEAFMRECGFSIMQSHNKEEM